MKQLECYKIVGVREVFSLTGSQMLSGFILRGVVGDVDVFVDGVFKQPDCLKEFLDKDGNIVHGMGEEYVKKELEWAKGQIGKTLSCDGLLFKAFATYGEVHIS